MNIEVYACNSCHGWMRKDFATYDLKCPLCGEETSMVMRELPEIKG